VRRSIFAHICKLTNVISANETPNTLIFFMEYRYKHNIPSPWCPRSAQRELPELDLFRR
jgi:hypothetical protein